MPWGWVEWFILSQTIFQSLLFVPGLSSAGSPVRPLVRISTFIIGVVIWVLVRRKGEPSASQASVPPRPWLIAAMVWLTVSLAHPNIYSVPAAVGQVVFYISILSPAFWGADSVMSPRRLSRAMAVLFLCNALSATVGLGQVFSDRFYPPYIPMADNQFEGTNLKIQVGGRFIFRPCGLSDTPGAAAPAGATTALMGLCFALQPIGLIRRAISTVLAFVGCAVIYYTQVRSLLLILAISLIAMTVFQVLQRRYVNALLLAGGGVGMVAGAFFWVSQRMAGAGERFLILVSSDVGNAIGRSRGGFVWETFTETIWKYPLGHGMGWWGMIHLLFQNPARLSVIWVEIMLTAWVIDGGFPLLVAYGGAVLIAVANSLRIALNSKDPVVSFWAAFVVAQNISTVTLCFSYQVFLSPIGQVFWITNAVVHAADFQARSLAENSRKAAPPRRPRPRLWPGQPGQAPT
jgi:hypothetical protein